TIYSFFFQSEDGIRYLNVTGVQTCVLPISIFQSINLTVLSVKSTCKDRWRHVLPKNLHKTYSEHQQDWLLNLKAFIYFVKKKQRSEERRVGKECRSR